jgi:type IV secretion system protein VirD4
MKKKYPGILLGKHPTKNIFLTSYGQTFVLLAAPPGSGKGVSFVIPNLLQFPDSVAVTDPKFENWNLTAGFRAYCGHECYRFSPELLETHRWNPLSFISHDELDRFSDIKTMASSFFVSANPENQSWYNNAGKIWAALVMYVMETPELPLTLPQVYEIISLGNRLPEWIQKTITARDNAGKPLSHECVREMTNIISMSSNERSWGTYIDILSEVMGMYGEKKVAWAVSGNDIDFENMRKKKMSVYFSVTSDNVPKFAPLMNIFFNQLMGENSKFLPEDGGVDENGELIHKYQIFMVEDEARAIGRIEKMKIAPALLRGYGFRFGLIFQNKHQLREKEMYGKEGGDAIMNAMHIEIAFAPPKQDVSSAEEYSKMLGTTTARVTQFSEANVPAKLKRNYSQAPRPLMLPQEIIDMPYDEELIFIQGNEKSKPLSIKARKIKWYEEDVFKSRAKIPAPKIPVASREDLNNLIIPIYIEEPLVTADFQDEYSADIQEEKNRRG